MNVGDRVKDKITGFKGIVVAKTEWLYGCTRLTVQPETLEKGATLKNETFDEPQLLLIKAGVVKGGYVPPTEPRTYGPRDDAAALSRDG
jgi:hypothetical protein